MTPTPGAPIRAGGTRVALIGATGHGGWHRRAIAALAETGRVELVGLCDLVDIPDAPPGVPVFHDHATLLTDVKPDVVVVCTPPHTHLAIATDVLRSGADLLLEKPPVLDLDQHAALSDVVAETGRAVQVGFQALGSAALARLRSEIAAGTLGTITGIGVRGAWFREEAYFRRRAWVGRSSLDGRPILDGALANPFAHALMQTLAVADSPVLDVTAERYRTRDIEVDDTACLRLVFESGVTAVIAVSLCSEKFIPGDLTITGTAGTAVLEYPTDKLRLPGSDCAEEIPGRTGLLANLLEHRSDPSVELVVPLPRTRPFTALLAPIVNAPVVSIPDEFLEVYADLATPRFAITGINDAIERCARDLTLFSEQALPWARPA
jgi:predicted dehydrogenase